MNEVSTGRQAFAIVIDRRSPIDADSARNTLLISVILSRFVGVVMSSVEVRSCEVFGLCGSRFSLLLGLFVT